MESRQERVREEVLRVLARKLDVGTVKELRNGVIEIDFDGQLMGVSVERYWIFMELMSEASRQFALAGVAAVVEKRSHEWGMPDQK